MEPHIHSDVANAIWSKICESNQDGPFHLQFVVPETDLGRVDEVRNVIVSHFRREEETASRDVRYIFRKGRKALWVGLLGVAALLGLGEFLSLLGEARVLRFMSESLVIIAWVVLWYPAELLLFEHLPVRRRRRQARALAASPVELVSAN